MAGFSTKPHFEDIILYEMRAVRNGRFLSRDPVNEKGFETISDVEIKTNDFGLLYGIARNNVINIWDILGLDPTFLKGIGGNDDAISDANKMWKEIKKRAPNDVKKMMSSLNEDIKITSNSMEILFYNKPSKLEDVTLDICDVKNSLYYYAFLHEVIEISIIKMKARKNKLNFYEAWEKFSDSAHSEALNYESLYTGYNRIDPVFADRWLSDDKQEILILFDKNGKHSLIEVNVLIYITKKEDGLLTVESNKGNVLSTNYIPYDSELGKKAIERFK